MKKLTMFLSQVFLNSSAKIRQNPRPCKFFQRMARIIKRPESFIMTKHLFLTRNKKPGG